MALSTIISLVYTPIMLDRLGDSEFGVYQAVSMINLDETVETMYPLMEPALENIADQVVEKQTTEGITYNADYQYTSVVLPSPIT